MRKDLALLASGIIALGAGCRSSNQSYAPDALMTPGLVRPQFYSATDRGQALTRTMLYCTPQGNREAYVTSVDLTGKVATDQAGKAVEVLPLALVPTESATRIFDMDGRRMTVHGQQYVLTKVGSKGVSFPGDGFVSLEDLQMASESGRTKVNSNQVELNLPIRYLGPVRFFEVTARNGSGQEELPVLYIPVSEKPGNNQITTTVSPDGKTRVDISGDVYQPVRVTLADAPKPVEPVQQEPTVSPVPVGELTQ